MAVLEIIHSFTSPFTLSRKFYVEEYTVSALIEWEKHF